MGKDTRQSIAPPPGFELEEDTLTVAPPPGFELETDQPRPRAVRVPGLGNTPEFNKGIDISTPEGAQAAQAGGLKRLPNGMYLPPELVGWLQQNREPSPDYATQLRQAGTTEQPELAGVTPGEAAIAGFSPVLQTAKNVVLPIVAGAQKGAGGFASLQPGQVSSFEDILRGGADLVSGAISAGINVLPPMMGVNAAMTVAPAVEDLASTTVGELTKRLAPIVDKDLNAKIAQHIGQRYGREATGTALEYGVAAKFGLPVLVGMVLSKGAGSVTENVLADKTIPQEDKVRILDLVKNIAFFGGILGTGRVRRAAGQFRGPIDVNRPITEPVGVSAGPVPSEISNMWDVRERVTAVTPPIAPIEAVAELPDFTVDALGRASTGPLPAEARPELRVTPREDILEDFQSIMTQHERPMAVEPKAPAGLPSGNIEEFLRQRRAQESLQARREQFNREKMIRQAPKATVRPVENVPEEPSDVGQIREDLQAAGVPVPDLVRMREPELRARWRKEAGVQPVTAVTPPIAPIEAVAELPEFRNSQEAIDYGRKNPQAGVILQQRADEAQANAQALIKNVPANETHTQKMERLNAAMQQAVRAQLAHEAIEYRLHPKRETPVEKLLRQQKEEREAPVAKVIRKEKPKQPSGRPGIMVKRFGWEKEKNVKADLLEDYKGRQIVQDAEKVAVWDPKEETLFYPALDDSKESGRRKWVKEANTVENARKYIDWVTKVQAEQARGRGKTAVEGVKATEEPATATPVPPEGFEIEEPKAPAEATPAAAAAPEPTGTTTGRPTFRTSDVPIDLATRAHSGTSFTPEKRGASEQQEYVEHMNAVYEDLEKSATTPEAKELLNQEIERYRQGYLAKTKDLLTSRSGIMSTMITGGSNFPVERMRKRNAALQNKEAAFQEWDRRARASIAKKLKAQRIEEAGGPIEVMKRNIETAEKNQERMRKANAILRSKSKSQEEKVAEMARLGFTGELVKNLQTPDFAGRSGFADYQLTNNNANIKRMRDRLAELERRGSTETSEQSFEGGKVIDSAEDDRIQIRFDTKPAADMIAKLKAQGFKWAPSSGVWQRMRTDNARIAVDGLLGTKTWGERIKGQAPGEPAVEPGVGGELPEGYRIRSTGGGGKYDVYDRNDEVVGTRPTYEAAVEYAKTHAETEAPAPATAAKETPEQLTHEAKVENHLATIGYTEERVAVPALDLQSDKPLGDYQQKLRDTHDDVQEFPEALNQKITELEDQRRQTKDRKERSKIDAELDALKDARGFPNAIFESNFIQAQEKAVDAAKALMLERARERNVDIDKLDDNEFYDTVSRELLDDSPEVSDNWNRPVKEIVDEIIDDFLGEAKPEEPTATKLARQRGDFEARKKASLTELDRLRSKAMNLEAGAGDPLAEDMLRAYQLYQKHGVAEVDLKNLQESINRFTDRYKQLSDAIEEPAPVRKEIGPGEESGEDYFANEEELAAHWSEKIDWDKAVFKGDRENLTTAELADLAEKYPAIAGQPTAPPAAKEAEGPPPEETPETPLRPEPIAAGKPWAEMSPGERDRWTTQNRINEINEQLADYRLRGGKTAKQKLREELKTLQAKLEAPEPLTPDKIDEAADAAGDAGLSMKRQGEHLVAKMEEAQAAVKSYDKEFEKLADKHEKDLFKLNKAKEMALEGIEWNDPKHKPISERYTKEEATLSSKHKAEKDKVTKKMADELRKTGMNIDDHNRLVVDVPGDGSFYTPIKKLQEGIDRIKGHWPTSVGVAKPLGKIGLGSDVSKKAKKEDYWLVPGTKDIYGVGGKIIYRGEAPGKGYSEADEVDWPVEHRGDKKFVEKYLSDKGVPAERIGHVLRDVDFGEEAVSSRPIAGGREGVPSKVIFKAGDRFYELNQDLWNAAKKLVGKFDSYKVDSQRKAVKLIRDGKTIGAVALLKASVEEAGARLAGYTAAEGKEMYGERFDNLVRGDYGYPEEEGVRPLRKTGTGGKPSEAAPPATRQRPEGAMGPGALGSRTRARYESYEFARQLDELPADEKAEIQPIEATEPKSVVKEFLDKSRKGLRPSKDLADALYKLETNNRADQIRARQLLERVDMTRDEAEELYRYEEDTSRPLSPELQRKYDEYIRPLKDATNEIIKEIKPEIPVSEENYTPRFVKGKGSTIDRIVSGIRKTFSGGNLLSRTAGFFKHRVMKALVDDAGNRVVAAIKGGLVTAWRDKKPFNMGPLKGKQIPAITEYYDEPVMNALNKLAKDLGIKHERKFNLGYGTEATAGVSWQGANAIATKPATPEDVLMHEIGHQLDERYGLQKLFVDDPKLKKEMRVLADLRIEGLEAGGRKVSDYYKHHIRKGTEKIAVMFQGYMHVPEKMKTVAPLTYAKLEKFIEAHDELKPIKDIKPTLVMGSTWTGEEKIPGTFKDRTGKLWRIEQARTDEIEAATNLSYHKNLLANRLVVFNKARQVGRAIEFMKNMTESPEFATIARKLTDPDIPQDYRATRLKTFAGYAFEPRTAEVLDHYAHRMERGDDPMRIVTAMNQFLRTAIFFNPLIHTPNITVHWLVNRGVSKFLIPGAYGDLFKTGVRAFNDVIHQNDNFLSALEEGAPLLYRSGEGVSDILTAKMGRELTEKPAMTKRIADALGYRNPATLVKAVYRFSSRVTWGVNDWAILQAMYEEMGHGKTMPEAIADVGKHIPNYRIPARVLNSTTVSKLMSNPNLTMFGAYHYGALKSYGEMAKSLLGDVPLKERAEALDKIAMFALTGIVIYPMLDEVAKAVTGNKNAGFRRAGATTFPYNIYKFSKGQMELTDVLQSVVTPTVGWKELIQLGFNRDLYSGKNIYRSEDIVDDPVRFLNDAGMTAVKSIAPFRAAERLAEGIVSPGQFVASLPGIKTPRETPVMQKARRVYGKTLTTQQDQEHQEQAAEIRSYLDKVKAHEQPSREEVQMARKLKYIKLDGTPSQKLQDALHLTPSQRFFKVMRIEDEWKTYQEMSDAEKSDYRRILSVKLQEGQEVISRELKHEISMALAEERRRIPRSTGSYGR